MVAFAAILVATLLGVLGWPGLLLGVAPLVYGLVLMRRGREALGATMVALAVVGPILGATVLRLAAKPYRIPSPAMIPTLQVGDRIVVNRVGGDPERGDIVVFHAPLGVEQHRCGVPSQPADGHPCSKPTAERSGANFVKRVVGLPGDTLFVKDNRAYVNGKPLDEPYVNESTPCDQLCNLPKPITIPPGYFFMLGDNRGASDDSRDWGPVPKKWIIGTVFLRYAPIGRLKLF